MPSPLLTRWERIRYSLAPRLSTWWRAHRYRRVHEPEMHLLPMLADPDRVSIDAGANRGVYSYFLSRLSKHVFAYEPNPAMCAYLRRVTGRKVTVCQAALSDANGPAELVVPYTAKGFYRNNCGYIRRPDHNDGVGQPLIVETRRLDDELLEPVGFIKIDVEGHEWALLQGARRIIERDRPVLLIELNEDDSGKRVDRSLRQIEALGYRSFKCVGRRLIDYRLILEWPSHDEPRRSYRLSKNVIFLPMGDDRPIVQLRTVA